MQAAILAKKAYFNPRSPHGERQRLDDSCIQRRAFQSTLPARGATSSTSSINSAVVFQSTLPARGATQTTADDKKVLQISIHAPRTGSDLHRALTINAVEISIHAPRTGSDGIGLPS